MLSRFYIFARDTRMVPDYETLPHREMCDELEQTMPEVGSGKTQKKQVFMAPRYSYKTTCLKAFMTYVFLKFRDKGTDVAIVYIRANQDLAMDVLFELKNDLKTNPIIFELFGDLEAQANIWAEEQINMGGRRDATISTGGLTVGKAGTHPDLVILDDIVYEDNFESIKAKRQARNKLQSFYPVLPPWGSIIVSGTFWAHNDVYTWLLEQNTRDQREFDRLILDGQPKEAEKWRPQWRVYVRSIYRDDGSLFFPARLSESFIEQQRRAIEPKFFSAWYLMRADVEGMVLFQESYLRYFACNYMPPVGKLGVPVIEILSDKEPELVPVYVTMTIDPTVTANSNSDWTGVVIVATDAQDRWWTLLARRYLEVPSTVGDEMVKLIAMFVPSIVRIESAQADVEMVARIERAILALELPTSIASYHALRDESKGVGGRPSRRKKSARIEALEPRFRRGDIRLQRGACGALIDQYKAWPDVDHDDVIDALSMQVGVARKCAFGSVRDAEIHVGLDLDDDPADEWAAYGVGSGAGGRALGRVGASTQYLPP